MRTRQAVFSSTPATRLVQYDSLIGFLYEGGSSLLWWLIADCGRICLQIVRLPAVLPYSTFRNPADGRLPRMAKTSGFSLFLRQLSWGDSSLTVAEFVSKLSGLPPFLPCCFRGVFPGYVPRCPFFDPFSRGLWV